jgi:hypothetical protein
MGRASTYPREPDGMPVANNFLSADQTIVLGSRNLQRLTKGITMKRSLAPQPITFSLIGPPFSEQDLIEG